MLQYNNNDCVFEIKQCYKLLYTTQHQHANFTQPTRRHGCCITPSPPQNGPGRSQVGLAPPSTRLCITARILDRMRVAIDQAGHPQRILLWAVVCITFFFYWGNSSLRACHCSAQPHC